jgi:hypothetical protein
MAAMTSASSPAASCWLVVAPATTFAGDHPVTVPLEGTENKTSRILIKRRRLKR